ncbi:MAG: hypothetical protein ABIE07_00035 [Candidatus Zixiibacteriota bacterium]
MLTRLLLLTVAIFTALFLINCGGTPKGVYLSHEQADNINENESLVFGWINSSIERQTVENGENYYQTGSLHRGLFGPISGYNPQISLVFIDSNTGNRITTSVSAWGDETLPFELILPEGIYRLWVIRNDQLLKDESPSAKHFDIPGGKKALFIGDIQLYTGVLGLEQGRAAMDTDQDQFDTRREEFLRLHPTFPGDVIRGPDLGSWVVRIKVRESGDN